ncbi:hypothetical protein C5C18_12795 [Rathayibacter tritici]|uniref:hypothetical protein n=1 Tax=Rathayibacter tritici TaxID=33888 RepID=UPI000CE75FC1|nr:hypothetical protein [Rathayibacter tritici]PPF27405.1 hypothetical protein C5C06_09625 [Rathayibacter tritici]PPF64751.1 hypothetical protein C5C21_11745 [Rathayibacter tritici]PPG05098.1 hypothetical protein C5C18_12795 [Rathayibacter tritici]PPI19250.1 hypothetical protein C5D07_02105 [Rathayibacter tritici]
MTDTARATGLLALTPARMTRKDQPIEARRAPDSASVGSPTVIGCRIDVSGHSFIVELDMARIFLRQVRRSLREGEGGLVLLRHVEGIEMIPFSRATPFDVSDIVCPDGVEPADARATLGLRR